MRWPLAYCPDCGGSLPTAPPVSIVVQVCPACGARHYHTSKPCAGALIMREGRLLLARRARPPRGGTWDIVGGFLNPDESPDVGALREAEEETGLRIELGSLVGVFLDRYADGDDCGDYTMNIYFDAVAHEGEALPADDVAELRWFAPDALPDDLAFPHEHEVLAQWRARQSLDPEGGLS